MDENKAPCNFWLNRWVIPSVVAPRDFPEIIESFDDVTSSCIKAAFNTNMIDGPRAMRTYRCIAAITKLTNVFHRNELNIANWEKNKSTLKPVMRFL